VNTINPSLIDHAKLILLHAPMTQDEKASAWDQFHNARDSADLTARLANVSMPDEVKASLVAGKKLSEPEPTPVDKAAAAIHRMSELDSKILELAESHPSVFRALLDAATKD
jgi:hypothetical protein